MSADNWAVCPRCRAGEDDTERETFREDYEIYGASGGTVMVDYNGYCTACKLGVSFTYERPFYTT